MWSLFMRLYPPFPTAHLTCSQQRVSSFLPLVNVPLGPGNAEVTLHEQGGIGRRLVEGTIPHRWTGHIGQTSMLEKANGITDQVEASWSQMPPRPARQLECVERAEVSHGEW